MNIEEKLKELNLNKNYTEEELNKAYERKLTELKTTYELLKFKLKKEDTIEYQEEVNKSLKKVEEVTMNIIMAEKIDENQGRMLLALMLKIKEKLKSHELDPALTIYLSNLKYDGSKDDLKILYDISTGTIPILENTPTRK